MAENVSPPPLIDLNEADPETLVALPGIGEKLARRIIEYRETVHRFEEPVEIVAVPGISRAMYEQFADQVTVSGSNNAAVASAVAEDPLQAASGIAAEDAPGDEVDPSELKVEAAENGHIILADKEHEAMKEDNIYLSPSDTERETAPKQENGAAPTSPAGVTPAASDHGVPASEPAPTPQMRRLSTWQLWLVAVVGILGGTALTLLIMQTINGSLLIDRHPHIQNLNQQVAILQGQNEALRVELQIMKDQLGEVTYTRLRQAESSIGALEQKQTILFGQVTTLKNDVDGKITALEEGTTALATQVSELADEAATLETQVSTLEQDSTQMQTAIETIQVDTGRFSTFLTGLTELLQGLAPAASSGE